jgi:transposase
MWGPAVRGVIESMNGSRFVHDKGLAPLACKTDKIDARVLATLSARDLVPEIWLPDPAIRRERELARFRLHLVRHRTTLKNRVHAALSGFGHPCPVSDLFGHAGRELLGRLAVPDPWRANIDVSLQLIDDLALQIAALTVQLKRQGADYRYIPLLVTAPGIGWINAYAIASDRRHRPFRLAGQAVRLYRPLAQGAPVRRRRRPRPHLEARPKYVRWALFEAALNACKHPYYAERYQHTKRRLGRQRGPKVPQIDPARRPTEAIRTC